MAARRGSDELRNVRTPGISLRAGDSAPRKAETLCLRVLDRGDNRELAIAQKGERHVFAGGVAPTRFAGRLSPLPAVRRKRRRFREAQREMCWRMSMVATCTLIASPRPENHQLEPDEELECLKHSSVSGAAGAPLSQPGFPTFLGRRSPPRTLFRPRVRSSLSPYRKLETVLGAGRRDLLRPGDGAPRKAETLCLRVLDRGDNREPAVAQKGERHVFAGGVAPTRFAGRLSPLPAVRRKRRRFREAQREIVLENVDGRDVHLDSASFLSASAFMARTRLAGLMSFAVGL
jgi:hypothetical protein